jgi:hypothetical protein
MLINVRDPRQWTYLRNLPQKKKNPGITLGQVRRLHSEPARKGREKKKRKKTLVLTVGSQPDKGGKKKKKLGINPGQPAGKGRGKKTLVLTLGRPSDLDFRTWTSIFEPGQTAVERTAMVVAALTTAVVATEKAKKKKKKVLSVCPSRSLNPN